MKLKPRTTKIVKSEKNPEIFIELLDNMIVGLQIGQRIFRIGDTVSATKNCSNVCKGSKGVITNLIEEHPAYLDPIPRYTELIYVKFTNFPQPFCCQPSQLA